MINATQGAKGTQFYPGGAPARNTGTLDQEDFLTLLVAQLKHQDPLSPMESQDFAAQMAQFSSLQSLQSIDQQIGYNLEASLLSTQAVSNAMAAGLIGKEVVAVGDSLILSDSNSTLRFSLSDPAHHVIITITDGNGKEVRTIQKEGLGEGEQIIAWDGKDDSGNQMSDGTYGYQVAAFDGEGNAVETLTTTSGIITGVNYEGGVAMLMVGDMLFPLSNVISIRMPE